ncbi:Lipase [Fulvia fulva]|nr:Lipase [Fulvia fulva]
MMQTFTSYPTLTAAIANGTYQGLYLPSFDQDAFLGIPFAQSTADQNRFRIPQSLNATWTGLRSAHSYSEACPDYSPGDWTYGVGENCLSINIVKPAGCEDKSLPVVMWIHGGSYQSGTSGLQNYNLSYIVEKSVQMGQPIVATSINYRKGGWGMLYSREGAGQTNLALRDMRKALEWVQENIESFSGNKSQVTIWGESAGSFAVGQLLMMYGGRSDDLFHGSIQESGSAATAWYNGSDWYQPIYDKIVSQVNCTEAIDTLACLRTVSYEELYPYLNTSIIDGPGWYPTVDGHTIPNYPTILLEEGDFAHVPHLYGTNSDEGTDNAPADGVINTDDDLRWYLRTQTGFGFPNSTIEEILRLYPDDPTQGIPLDTGTERFEEHGYRYKRVAAIHRDTYMDRFNTRPTANYVDALQANTTLNPDYKGVAHASELGYVFNNPAFLGNEALSEQMAAQWINFIYYGNPNGADLPHWPTYDEGEQGLNLVLQPNSSYVEEDTYRLAGREYLTKWARRRHV